MKKTLFLLFLFVLTLKSFSQQQYFMYIQADDRKPFYAKISNRMYSSSESGYIIIPKLEDSSYDITIGFAKNAFSEQRFPVAVNKKDRGFQLKNLGDKGWALINLQTMGIILNTAQSKKTETGLSGVKKTDPFSELLANVVNDSAVLYTPVIATSLPVAATEKLPVENKNDKQKADSEAVTKSGTVVKPEINQVAEQKDTIGSSLASSANSSTNISKESSPLPVNPVIAPQAVVVKNAVKDSTVTAKPVIEKPFITRIDEKRTANMYEATYLELYTLTTDTIRIFIPLKDTAVAALAESTEKRTEPVAEQNISQDDKTNMQAPAKDSAVSKKNVLEIINSDCKSFATDYDVDKFRIKLLDDKTIVDKIASSKKYFRSKCYSVNQVRALSELFPSDETKYQFFETAYPHVSDTSNFYSLEEMIQNDLYKNRFKVLTHRQ